MVHWSGIDIILSQKAQEGRYLCTINIKNVIFFGDEPPPTSLGESVERKLHF